MWDQSHDKALNEVKSILTKAPVRKYFSQQKKVSSSMRRIKGRSRSMSYARRTSYCLCLKSLNPH